MPHEEKPTLIEVELAHRYGFQPVPLIHATHHYVRVTYESKTGQRMVEVLPCDLLDRVTPLPRGREVCARWDDALYVSRLRACIFDHCGSFDEPQSFKLGKKLRTR